MESVAEDILTADDSYNGNADLMHYGVKRRSGRYPYGSGENPYQHSGDFLSRVEELKKQGCSEKDIAEMELRIYQNDEVLIHNPEVDEIVPIMDKIIAFDKLLEKVKSEEE